ncbi:MAG TPA: ribonuclease H-like domain-containing protein [Candidatus Bilamarchaeum sp.]|nr:ribonuclease H-like domain-containing protein [Candidatus Bilamarchaeum sp.]
MLRNTFIHLPDFGPRRERRLWGSGVSDWEEFLDKFGSSEYHRHQCSLIARSQYCLSRKEPEFFAESLPSSETWRAFPEFRKIAYLDIETTGLAPQTDYVTVIGLFDGEDTHSYVHGQNLGDFLKEISGYEMVVTFNGSLFDIPFLKKAFPGVRIPRLHVDLRFLLQSLNVRGGLKRIEESFGYEREGDLKGLNGYDAVKFWQAYIKRNDRDALDRLIRYNAADISNLKKLLEWAYREKRVRTGFDEIVNSVSIN